jgi:hypothetical protein
MATVIARHKSHFTRFLILRTPVVVIVAVVVATLWTIIVITGMHVVVINFPLIHWPLVFLKGLCSGHSRECGEPVQGQ